jgi:hypothetical protein
MHELVRLMAVTLAAIMFASGSSLSAQLPPPDDYFIAEGSVDLYQGNLMLSVQDLVVGSAGAGQMVLQRHHTGQSGSSAFGGGSTHNHRIYVFVHPYINPLIGFPNYSYEYYVTFGQEHLKFTQEYGTSTAIYEGGKAGTHQLVMAQIGNPERYIGPDGTQVIFGSGGTYWCASGAPCKDVLEVRAPSGDVTKYHYHNYSTSGPPKMRLSYILNNRGFGLGFEYSSQGGTLISKACALNASISAINVSLPCQNSTMDTSYTYQASGLATATDTTGTVSHYSYYTSGSMGMLESIRYAQEATPVVTFEYYPGSGKISRQTFADGSYRIYRYLYNQDPWYQVPANEWTEVEVPGGGVRRYEFGGSSWGAKPVKFIDELLRVATFAYTWAPHATAVMTRQTFPEGNSIEYEYGVRANVTKQTHVPKPWSSEPAFFTRADFPASCSNLVICEKPLWTEDARGNRTDYTYDPVHGGILTRTGPAVGGVRPQTRYEYQQRYAYLNNGSGGFSPHPEPVWILTAEEFCRTTAAVGAGCAGGTTDETRITYEYGPASGPNNLLLRGMVVSANGTSLRTCYSYDGWGRKISETQPNANLASCP